MVVAEGLDRASLMTSRAVFWSWGRDDSEGGTPHADINARPSKTARRLLTIRKHRLRQMEFNLDTGKGTRRIIT